MTQHKQYAETIRTRAKTAIALALLHYSNRTTEFQVGSFNQDTVAPRIKRAIEAGMTEEDLTTLLEMVANEAVQAATGEAQWIASRLIREAQQQAERSDSLSFHRYVEDLQARIENQEHQREPLTVQEEVARLIDHPHVQTGTMSDQAIDIMTGGLLSAERIKPTPTTGPRMNKAGEIIEADKDFDTRWREAEEPRTSKQLDPTPWTVEGMENPRRYSRRAVIPNTSIPLWIPRPGYEQEPDRYPHEVIATVPQPSTN